MGRQRALRDTCAICDATLDYPSWHCTRCVEEKRVCRMCETSIADKRPHAEYCTGNHRAAWNYEKKIAQESVESVEYVSDEAFKEQMREWFTVLDEREQVRHEQAIQHFEARLEAVIEKIAVVPPAPPLEQSVVDPLIGPANRSADLQQEIRDDLRGLRGDIKELIAVLEAAPRPAVTYADDDTQPAPVMTSGNLKGPKLIAGANIATPPPDEDDDMGDLLEIKEDVNAGARATQNFINSLMALQTAPAKEGATPRTPAKDYRSRKAVEIDIIGEDENGAEV